MLVRLIFPKKFTTIFRFCPNRVNQIGDIVFTADEVNEADLAIVVNFSPKEIKIKARELWVFHQEPDNYEYFGHWIKTYKHADRAFGCWENIKEKECKNFYKTQASVFWYVKEDYDFYKNLKTPEKPVLLSAMTSSKSMFIGHRERLKFLFALQEKFKNSPLEFEIRGNGINPVFSKDEVLIPSKYSICLENTKQNHYFTEKLQDAILCNSMPIYYGAPDIFDYFPKNSLILIDKLDVEYAQNIIKNAIENNFYEKNFEALMEAKDLVLNKYNFFMNVCEKIKEFDIKNKEMKEIFIPKSRKINHPVISKIKNFCRTF